MAGQTECIRFETEEGEQVSFFVVEETVLAGESYLLVTDSEEDGAEAYIMRKVRDEENQLIYEMVEDEEILEALSRVFAEMLDDVEFMGP